MSNLSPSSQFLICQTWDGKINIDVRYEDESVWLTQQLMAELFQTSVPNISMHIRNVFAESELQPDSVVKESLTTAADGKNYATKFDTFHRQRIAVNAHRTDDFERSIQQLPAGKPVRNKKRGKA